MIWKVLIIINLIATAWAVFGVIENTKSIGTLIDMYDLVKGILAGLHNKIKKIEKERKS